MGVDKTGIDEMGVDKMGICSVKFFAIIIMYHTTNMSEGIGQNKKFFMVPMYFADSKLALCF